MFYLENPRRAREQKLFNKTLLHIAFSFNNGFLPASPTAPATKSSGVYAVYQSQKGLAATEWNCTSRKGKLFAFCSSLISSRYLQPGLIDGLGFCCFCVFFSKFRVFLKRKPQLETYFVHSWKTYSSAKKGTFSTWKMFCSPMKISSSSIECSIILFWEGWCFIWKSANSEGSL